MWDFFFSKALYCLSGIRSKSFNIFRSRYVGVQRSGSAPILCKSCLLSISSNHARLSLIKYELNICFIKHNSGIKSCGLIVIETFPLPPIPRIYKPKESTGLYTSFPYLFFPLSGLTKLGALEEISEPRLSSNFFKISLGDIASFFSS